MTQEEAQRLYRRRINFEAGDSRNWFNEPRNWAEADRGLTPAELEYAIKALCVGRAE